MWHFHVFTTFIVRNPIVIIIEPQVSPVASLNSRLLRAQISDFKKIECFLKRKSRAFQRYHFYVKRIFKSVRFATKRKIVFYLYANLLEQADRAPTWNPLSHVEEIRIERDGHSYVSVEKSCWSVPLHDSASV